MARDNFEYDPGLFEVFEPGILKGDSPLRYILKESFYVCQKSTKQSYLAVIIKVIADGNVPLSSIWPVFFLVQTQEINEIHRPIASVICFDCAVCGLMFSMKTKNAKVTLGHELYYC